MIPLAWGPSLFLVDRPPWVLLRLWTGEQGSVNIREREREREMFYLTTQSTHFIYAYMALRTILIVRKETRCRHIGYSYRLTARVLLYAPSHRQDNTYHGLCYTSSGAMAGTRNSSMDVLTLWLNISIFRLLLEKVKQKCSSRLIILK